MFHIVRLQFLLMLFCILFVSISAPNSVNACSGGPQRPPSIGELAEASEYVVYGQIVQIDEIHHNAVMRVISYLDGTPDAEYILLTLRGANGYLLNRERWASGGCTFIVPAFVLGEEIAIFLNRNVVGGYSQADGSNYYYRFTGQNATTTIYEPVEPSEKTNGMNYTAVQANYDEFTTLVEQASGNAAQAPIKDQPFPWLAPLLITTEAGTEYLLPVDGAPPLLLNDETSPTGSRGIRKQPACWSSECFAFSPNYLDKAYVNEDGSVQLTTGLWITGNALVFSPTSDAFAVWNLENAQAQLQVYQLTYGRINRIDMMGTAEKFSEFNLQLAELRSNIGAWSPDGRRLAFSDDRGVWIWDALTPDAQPELLTNKPASTIGFSPLGRYLVINDKEGGQSLDLVSGLTYPRGVFSPDERLVATLDNDFRIIQTLTNAVFDNQDNLLEDTTHQLEWIDEATYIVLSCSHNDENICTVKIQEVMALVNARSVPGTAFAIDSETGLIAIIQDGYHLRLQYSNNVVEEKRNLKPWIDGKITAVEWLPSLFYRSF